MNNDFSCFLRRFCSNKAAAFFCVGKNLCHAGYEFQIRAGLVFRAEAENEDLGDVVLPFVVVDAGGLEPHGGDEGVRSRRARVRHGDGVARIGADDRFALKKVLEADGRVDRRIVAFDDVEKLAEDAFLRVALQVDDDVLLREDGIH